METTEITPKAGMWYDACRQRYCHLLKEPPPQDALLKDPSAGKLIVGHQCRPNRFYIMEGEETRSRPEHLLIRAQQNRRISVHQHTNVQCAELAKALRFDIAVFQRSQECMLFGMALGRTNHSQYRIHRDQLRCGEQNMVFPSRCDFVSYLAEGMLAVVHSERSAWTLARWDGSTFVCSPHLRFRSEICSAFAYGDQSIFFALTANVCSVSVSCMWGTPAPQSIFGARRGDAVTSLCAAGGKVIVGCRSGVVFSAWSDGSSRKLVLRRGSSVTALAFNNERQWVAIRTADLACCIADFPSFSVLYDICPGIGSEWHPNAGVVFCSSSIVVTGRHTVGCYDVDNGTATVSLCKDALAAHPHVYRDTLVLNWWTDFHSLALVMYFHQLSVVQSCVPLDVVLLFLFAKVGLQ